MVEYNMINFCRRCRARFVVGRRDSKRAYCDKCEKIKDKEN